MNLIDLDTISYHDLVTHLHDRVKAEIGQPVSAISLALSTEHSHSWLAVHLDETYNKDVFFVELGQTVPEAFEKFKIRHAQKFTTPLHADTFRSV